jgi:hypothetical protein
MELGVKKVVIVPDCSPLLGVADESFAQRLAREVELFATAGRATIVSNLRQMRGHASRAAPRRRRSSWIANCSKARRLPNRSIISGRLRP